ncbi:VCBS repeat-containing protein [bacterium]|nr:VCBS repeat-containing protein [bacterium]
MYSKKIVFILCFILAFSLFASEADQYSTNPKVISISGTMARYGDHFIVADLNADGAMDFLYRTTTTLYAYDHDGTALWNVSVALEAELNGTSIAAGDIDGDGIMEVLVLNDADQILILTGSTGVEEDRIDVTVLANQRASYFQIVNLRGEGDRDIIVQMNDVDLEGNQNYYVNRSLVAIRVDTEAEIWRVDQDRVGSSGATWYEGYWGQAHGAFFAVDIDGDGLDEVVGGTWVDHDGTVVDVNCPKDWVGEENPTYIDHLDAIVVGDFRPDLAGLEWAMTEEDRHGDVAYNTTLMTSSDTLWRKETTLFVDDVNNDREPQNLVAGDFDPARSNIEFWMRSRFNYDDNSGNGQQPWVFDIDGSQFNDYYTKDMLPDGFCEKHATNNYRAHGLEMIWNVDWDGSGTEYIVGKARRGYGHVGIFNAATGTAVWTSMSSVDTLQAKTLYVADIAGDSREEIIVVDLEDNTIKIFHNADTYIDNQPNKWDDPLYRRLKQNWSYYSPGSYTARSTVQLAIDVFLEGPYSTADDAMSTALMESSYLPIASPYSEDPLILGSTADIPANVTDWVLVELRATADGHAIYQQSAFLRNDGRIIDEKGNSFINAFVERQASYYIVVKHRNHLAVMSASAHDFTSGIVAYDFTTATSKYYGTDAALLESGVYGMYAGDANGSSGINATDYLSLKTQIGESGYYTQDVNVSGLLNATDYLIIKPNVGKVSQI